MFLNPNPTLAYIFFFLGLSITRPMCVYFHSEEIIDGCTRASESNFNCKAWPSKGDICLHRREITFTFLFFLILVLLLEHAIFSGA